jgi:hypothetical protein
MEKKAMPSGRQVYEYISQQNNDPIVEWKICGKFVQNQEKNFLFSNHTSYFTKR